MSTPRSTGGNTRTGLTALAFSVLLCGAAHLLLRSGATRLSPDLLTNWQLMLGLTVYGGGTLLWIHSLGKLDLSLAFPATATQFVLVFAGAHWILGESISNLQLIGSAIILLGIMMLFFERGRTSDA